MFEKLFKSSISTRHFVFKIKNGAELFTVNFDIKSSASETECPSLIWFNWIFCQLLHAHPHFFREGNA